MREILKKHKLFVITAGYCLVVFLIMFFLAGFFIKKIDEKANSIQRKKIDNEINRERIRKIPQMEEMDKLIESKNEEINAILDPDGEVEFIESLESLAEATGNKMNIKVDDSNQFDTKPKKAAGNKKDDKKTIKENLSYDKYISMEIDLEGSYQGMLDFIYRLENFKYYVNILSIDLKKETKVEKSISAGAVTKPASLFSVSGSQLTEEKIEKREKDTLTSIISIIVYKKE